MAQNYSFRFADSVIAEAGRVSLDSLHFDADAILHAYESIKPVAERLGVAAPNPSLAGFCYAPLSALGAKITFPEDSEPKPETLINSPEEIDSLEEPEDYLSAKVVQKRLRVVEELKSRCPDAGTSIGHLVEGPVTTAVLILGESFLTLPYDDPERAHRLLDFAVRTNLNYAYAITGYSGGTFTPSPRGIPDDFAGIFSPALFQQFVLPYWNAMYEGLLATKRHLHSELLRVEHLPFLDGAGIAVFDPGADQHLTPELLKEHCPIPFTILIKSWQIRHLSPGELKDLYRHLTSFEPRSISFSMERLEDEEKIAALLEIARQLQA